jgi:acyl-CoA reductase-like NAD-dependent aldehyde dehydrogenase
VVDTLAGFASSLPVGDALDPATLIGPLVSERRRDRVERYIAKGKSDGARLVTVGYLPEPDPAGPWGGVKSSGIGRELGPGAIVAYQNLKTVCA